MKKKFISLVLIFCALIVNAQNVEKKSIKSTSMNKVEKFNLNGRESHATQGGFVPEFLKADFGAPTGLTFYDVVTNATSRNTIANWSDGTYAVAWTMAGATNSPSRGTGYNYFNGNTWNPTPNPATDRIETQRAGFGVMAALGDGEIVVSHSDDEGLLINRRPVKGTGNWTQTLLSPKIVGDNGDTNSILLWPEIATVENTVHIVALTDNDTNFLYDGVYTCLLYFRSTDGGATWSEPTLLPHITAEELDWISANGYSFVAKDDKLVFITYANWLGIFYLESTDNGETWTRHDVYMPEMDFSIVFPQTYVPDQTFDVAIDDDGKVHVAFGACLVWRDEDSEENHYMSYTYGYLSKIIYWNSTMPTLPVLDTINIANYTTIAAPDLNGDGEWTFAGVPIPEYKTRQNANATLPQLVTEDGKVYLTYAAVLEDPFIYDVGSAVSHYYGIFATVSNDNGATWDDNKISWLSYSIDTYFINWQSSVLHGDDPYVVALQESDNFWVSVAHNSVNGNLNMMWYYDYTPGSTGGFSNNGTSIYGFSIPKDSIGIYCNTTEVYQGLWNWIGIEENSLSQMKVYPNPATNMVTVAVNSKMTGNGTLTVTNIMGQTVYNEGISLQTNDNSFTINVSNFSAGIYMVNVRTDTGISTQKLIVK